jgi:predicted amidophosphoribosyltransferase
MPFIVDAISALSELVYPRICPACDGPLESGRKDICVTCSVTLPLTDFHLWDDNPVARHFWGRADVTAATALLHFQKEVLGVPVLENILLRHVPTASQTRKGRLQRWSNVDGKFGLQRTESIAGTHILIVDDVITTGATLEACIQLLQQVQGVKVSVAAVAHAVS